MVILTKPRPRCHPVIAARASSIVRTFARPSYRRGSANPRGANFAQFRCRCYSEGGRWLRKGLSGVFRYIGERRWPSLRGGRSGIVRYVGQLTARAGELTADCWGGGATWQQQGERQSAVWPGGRRGRAESASLGTVQ